MRRVAASVLAFGLAAGLHLGAATPAHAGTATVEFTTPGPGQVMAASTFDFRARVSTGSGTLRDKVFVDIASLQGHPGVSFEADTNERPSIDIARAVTFAWNGSYRTTVRAAAKSDFFDSDTPHKSTTSDFSVDAPPGAPGGVRATDDSKTRVVTVSWAPNGEPDMVGYEVEKKSSSGAWTSFAVTDRTSVTDESTANAGGTYWYRVRALRRSAQPGRLNPSGFSSEAGATTPAPPVQTTPTTTTTTTAPGQTGGSTGGTTTGSTGGGTSGGSAFGGSSGGASRSAPAFFGSGDKVSLDQFQALLRQQQGGPAVAPPPPDDGTYDESLPFGPRTEADDDEDDDDEEAGGQEALGEAPLSEGNDNLPATAFLAGGLLATVLAMHVLWVRSEVRQAEALETLIPAAVVEARPEGRRRRRPSPVAR